MGYVLLTAFFGWWQETQDTWHYGYPRTYQMDAMVGHSDSAQHPSHFIALNLHGQVEVIEFPGGDASHARVYVGPTLMGTNANLAVVTLSFQDVNGDGKPDLVINVQGGISSSSTPARSSGLSPPVTMSICLIRKKRPCERA